jgi:hypothetical protein
MYFSCFIYLCAQRMLDFRSRKDATSEKCRKEDNFVMDTPTDTKHPSCVLSRLYQRMTHNNSRCNNQHVIETRFYRDNFASEVPLLLF